MSDTLFNLTGQYLALIDLAAATDAEEDQAFLDTLEGITGEIAEKADSYVYVMAKIDGNVETVSKEIDRLTKIKTALENHKKAMKDSLFNAMKAMDMPEIKTDLHKLKICKNGGKIPVIYDWDENKPEAWPEKYQAQKIVLNKDRVREDLEAGVELSGAHLGERGEHLRIS